MSGLQRWLSWSKAHDWKSCLRGTVTRVRIPFSAPNKKVPNKGAFCLCNERGRDSKGTAERSEAKKRPVDVFLVPRAGGGTAPVPPDESLSLRQTKKYPIRVLFVYAMKEEGIRRERRKGFQAVRELLCTDGRSFTFRTLLPFTLFRHGPWNNPAVS